MRHNLRFDRHGVLAVVAAVTSGGMNAAQQVRVESRRVIRSEPTLAKGRDHQVLVVVIPDGLKGVHTR